MIRRTLAIVYLCAVECTLIAQEPATDPARTGPPPAAAKLSSLVQRTGSDASAVTVNPAQPYRPLPQNRVQPRESFFEFVFRSLNPRKINWGEEIDRRLGIFVQESVGNPYFRVCAFQAGLILFLLLLCWVWWDKMQQTKTVAAECLTDVINAKRLSDGRALEATDTYNRHMEMCNRVIEQQDSGISIGKGTADWQQKVDELQTQLAAERTQVARLEADRKQREELTAQMQTRIARLEERLRESGGNASAELVALVHRLEAELSSRAPAKK